MYLVIDTWVWCKAQTGECVDSGLFLLSVIKSNSHKVILDDECEIENEYRTQIKDIFWIKTYLKMIQKNCFIYKAKIRIVINGFDPSDMKFIQVAASIPGTPIISGDSDFLKLRSQISTYNILTPSEILSKI